MTPHSLDVAAGLARAAESINAGRTLEQTLDAVVAATRISLLQFPHVSLSLKDRGGDIVTVSATDQLVRDLDAVQYDLGEGPCVDAIGEASIVVVQDLRREQRWPRYVPAALEQGVRSQMGVRLFAGGVHIGGLNLYSRDVVQIDDSCTATARLFATHASIVLGHAQQEDQLSTALGTRKVIGQATGIVMERYRIDPDQAFRFLVRTATNNNVKLRDLAAELVASAVEEYRRP